MNVQRFNIGPAPATLIVDQGGEPSNMKVTVRNTHATQSIDIGPLGVTSGAGFEVKAGEEHDFELGMGDRMYAVAAAAQSVPVEVETNYVQGA